jgi:hypothetical protein
MVNNLEFRNELSGSPTRKNGLVDLHPNVRNIGLRNGQFCMDKMTCANHDKGGNAMPVEEILH